MSSSEASRASRRRERTTLWQDSGFFHDSFFAPDTRSGAPNSEMGSLASRAGGNSTLGNEGPPTEPPEPQADERRGPRTPPSPPSPLRH